MFKAAYEQSLGRGGFSTDLYCGNDGVEVGHGPGTMVFKDEVCTQRRQPLIGVGFYVGAGKSGDGWRGGNTSVQT
jgi:hypothetical protein